MGALDGIKVLDLSRLLPGPFCTMLMADMGAEVLKIEDTKGGDYIRWWEPMLGKNSGMHTVLNRNKRSMKLNLKTTSGKKIFFQLVKNNDVVVEGFRPGVANRLGIGYEDLSKVNPKLIYCAISGYGSTGPMSKKAGHDINYLALNGVLSYCGKFGKPVLPGVQLADIAGGGMLAAFSILAALIARDRIGKGQFIDIGMADGAFLLNCLRIGNWIADGIVPSPGDSMLNGGFACYNVYETRDNRFMALGALEPKFWAAFCKTIQREDLNTPMYFKAGNHQKQLKGELSFIFKKKTQSEWMAIFKDVDCCCEPVMSLDEVSEHPQFQLREMIIKMKHPDFGPYLQMGIAQKFSRTPGTIKKYAPEYGEDTESVLKELGFSKEQVEDFKDNGVI